MASLRRRSRSRPSARSGKAKVTKLGSRRGGSGKRTNNKKKRLKLGSVPAHDQASIQGFHAAAEVVDDSDGEAYQVAVRAVAGHARGTRLGGAGRAAPGRAGADGRRPVVRVGAKATVNRRSSPTRVSVQGRDTHNKHVLSDVDLPPYVQSVIAEASPEARAAPTQLGSKRRAKAEVGRRKGRKGRKAVLAAAPSPSLDVKRSRGGRRRESPAAAAAVASRSRLQQLLGDLDDLDEDEEDDDYGERPVSRELHRELGDGDDWVTDDEALDDEPDRRSNNQAIDAIALTAARAAATRSPAAFHPRSRAQENQLKQLHLGSGGAFPWEQPTAGNSSPAPKRRGRAQRQRAPASGPASSRDDKIEQFAASMQRDAAADPEPPRRGGRGRREPRTVSELERLMPQSARGRQREPADDSSSALSSFFTGGKAVPERRATRAVRGPESAHPVGENEVQRRRRLRREAQARQREALDAQMARKEKKSRSRPSHEEVEDRVAQVAEEIYTSPSHARARANRAQAMGSHGFSHGGNLDPKAVERAKKRAQQAILLEQIEEKKRKKAEEERRRRQEEEEEERRVKLELQQLQEQYLSPGKGHSPSRRRGQPQMQSASKGAAAVPRTPMTVSPVPSPKRSPMRSPARLKVRRNVLRVHETEPPEGEPEPSPTNAQIEELSEKYERMLAEQELLRDKVLAQERRYSLLQEETQLERDARRDAQRELAQLRDKLEDLDEERSRARPRRKAPRAQSAVRRRGRNKSKPKSKPKPKPKPKARGKKRRPAGRRRVSSAKPAKTTQPLYDINGRRIKRKPAEARRGRHVVDEFSDDDAYYQEEEEPVRTSYKDLGGVSKFVDQDDIMHSIVSSPARVSPARGGHPAALPGMISSPYASPKGKPYRAPRVGNPWSQMQG